MGTKLLVATMSCFAILSACRPAHQVTGSLSYEAVEALPPEAVLEVRLEDVSRADAPSQLVASQSFPEPGSSPVSFSLSYVPDKIETRHAYALRATIRVGGKLLYTTDTRYPVLTQGHPATADLKLVLVAAAPQEPKSGSLVDTYWRLARLGDRELGAAPADRKPHLRFSSEGKTFSGNGGCNLIRGSYTLDGQQLKLSQLISTKMACPPDYDVETDFLRTLEVVKSYEIRDGALELKDEKGETLATFIAVANK